ncbi:hypothetical protein SY88_20670 [Clostridiales bacterium PH28_bin88]|nr:hypothetical protein SY88_20670 [Clostridiales bacterium PH28_bin88]
MKALAKGEGIFVGVLLVVMSLAAFVQVLTRYVFKIPLPWIEEFIRYLMIWMVFVGGGLAVTTKSHLAIDVMEVILPRKISRVVSVVIDLVVLVFAVIFGYMSYQFMSSQIQLGQVSPALQVSMGWVDAAMLAGGILIAIHTVERLVNQFKGVAS